MNSVQIRPQEPRHHRYVILTGATGLVGQYVMRDLIARGESLAVVVRPQKKQSAQVRIEQIMQRCERDLGRLLPRPVVLEGDVAQPSLGLSEFDRQWVAEHCDRMIHGAAVLTFTGQRPDQEPWPTNLEGTRHSIEFAKSCKIDQYHYISTAYVCGNRKDVIYEDEFDCGQQFRNDYERSKFEAERLVREANFQSVTIYRPVVIGGDSTTGFTPSFHGMYVYLRLFAMLVPQQQRDENGKYLTRVQLPLTGDEPRNVVPVEWVSRVICEIFNNREAHGRTYHISPDKPFTARDLIDPCYDFFNSTGVEYVGQGADCQNIDQDFAERILESTTMYQDYETSDPTFDKSNLLEFAGHLPCPTIDHQVVTRYLEYGIAERWGKRKRTAVEIPNFHHCLESIAAASYRYEKRIGKPIHCFGIRLTGPGGGDWSIYRNGKGPEILRGWTRRPSIMVELQTCDLYAAVQDQSFCWESMLEPHFHVATQLQIQHL